MQEQIVELQRNYEQQLRNAAVGYLRTGLDLFHKYRASLIAFQKHSHADILGSMQRPSPQPAIGNLSISVELMLKAIIARKHLPLLFKNMSDEFRILWTCPESLPESSYWRLWRKFDLYLKSSREKTVDFDQSRSIALTFFPDLKESSDSYLKTIRKFRNASVHSALPKLHHLEVERIAYAAIHVQEVLNDTLNPEGFPIKFNMTGYVSTKKDEKFIRTFQEERLARVNKKISNAKDKAEKIAGERLTAQADDWQHFVIRCPICENDAVLAGETELDEVYTLDHNMEPVLDEVRLNFVPDGFHCSHCDLALDNVDELRLAGFLLCYDRSHELDAYLSQVDYKLE